ncbi:isopentenyl-diphosphate delta-isomerase, partial [Xanthomonas citri pv. citri]|nr:isopentenyl-diphosphate delta-isomerase [Xanthomonas citri pv. citri]
MQTPATPSPHDRPSPVVRPWMAASDVPVAGP